MNAELEIGDIVFAATGCASYFTPYKSYKVESIGIRGTIFIIKDDYGVRQTCFLNGSTHLNGGNWTVVKMNDEENIIAHSKSIVDNLRNTFVSRDEKILYWAKQLENKLLSANQLVENVKWLLENIK